MTVTVAALYVEEGGVYYGLEGVDPWPESRDARLYAGPYPVVAHPECSRFGRWAGDERGQDDGCFEAAKAAVERYGGVLEHPEGSFAWKKFALIKPPRSGGWIAAGNGIGWTCCVEQGHYGHRARKMTWLYCARVNPPPLVWGPSVAAIGPRPGRDPVRERRIGAVQRMCRRERRATPPAFASLLLSIARSAAPGASLESE